MAAADLVPALLGSGGATGIGGEVEKQFDDLRSRMRRPLLDNLDDLSHSLVNWGLVFGIAGAVAWFVGTWSQKAAQSAAADEVSRLQAIAGSFSNATAPVTWDPTTWGNAFTDAGNLASDTGKAIFSSITVLPHVLYDGFVFTVGSSVGTVLADVAPFLLLAGLLMIVVGLALSEGAPQLIARLKAATGRMKLDRKTATEANEQNAAKAETRALAEGEVVPGLPPSTPTVIDGGPAPEPEQSEPMAVVGAGVPPVMSPPPDREPLEPTPTAKVEEELGKADSRDLTDDELELAEKRRKESMPEPDPTPEPAPEPDPEPDEPSGYDRMMAADAAFASAST